VTGISLDASAVVARLRELDERSGGRRVAWTETWRDERSRLREWLESEVPGAQVEVDQAGNLWTRLPGDSDDTVVVGSHIDCVPAGGWLDGCLGVLAGAAVLAEIARGGRPARSVALVDWADEEGARFGYSLLGSSAAAGLLDVEAAAGLRDADGAALPDVLAENGVRLADMPGAAAELSGAVAYLELHIEQGPALEALELPVAAVDGCVGIRRSALIFHGNPSHAGTTPMNLRQDPVQAAASFVTGLREAANTEFGVVTVGVLRSEPATPTAIPAEVQLTVDLRHRELATLERLAAKADSLARRAAEAEGCTFERSPLWSIDPVRFDPALVARAQALAGEGEPLTSGALHDAASMSRAGVPTAMLFVRTLGGISHSREEDAREEDLVAGIEAFADLVAELASAGEEVEHGT
jgi:hydantoinase/carbamoylase family amidase